MPAMKILGALLAALLLAPAAHADTTDQQYLGALATYRLGCGQGVFTCPDGDADMIQIGQQICHAIGNGSAETSVAAQLLRLTPGLGADQSMQLVHTAERSYCPR